ncbi:N-acetylmuramidase family protein [Burkholderia pyrrocinia]
MANSQPTDAPAPKTKTQPAAFVEVTVLFRDVLRKPIEGLSVQLTAGKGTPPAPVWQTGPDPTTVHETPAAKTDPATPASAATAASATTATALPGHAAAPAAPSSSADPSTPPHPDSKTAAGSPPSPPVSDNMTQATTDKDGFAVTITNAARNQPIDVAVKNRRGEYAWKTQIVPKKDISAFTIVSPEYHLEATTQLTPKDEFEQNLNLPVVKQGEVMTIERLIREFGPYIGWTQKVTEQGRVIKDFPTKNKEITVDPKSHKKKTKITIEHHYKVVDTGKPNTVPLSVFGSRLNYPNPETFSDAQLQHMASALNVEIAAIKAIVQQESQGHPFMENGLPPILYERTVFYSIANLKIAAAAKAAAKAAEEAAEKTAPKDAKSKGKKKKWKAPPETNPYPNYPDLCFKTHEPYGKDGLHQYEKLIRACSLDAEVALQSCSWGGFQILGQNYAGCGCSTVFEFADKFMSGTDGQTEIFILFMKNVKPEALAGLREHNWEKVAAGYNGLYWKKYNPDYAKNIGKYYESFK